LSSAPPKPPSGKNQSILFFILLYEKDFVSLHPKITTESPIWLRQEKTFSVRVLPKTWRNDDEKEY
jgi:hypothetical protein